METLIILFVLYSLFQWLFGDNKKKQQQKQKQRQQREQAAGAGAESNQPQSWEDAMKELESIFTGEPTPSRQPEPEPSPRQQKPEPFMQKQQPVPTDRFSDDPFSDDMTTKRRSFNSGIDTKELETSGNPIYSREIGSDDEDFISEGGIDTVQAKDVLEYINNPEAARKAIIMKEILDRPKSLRKSARIW